MDEELTLDELRRLEAARKLRSIPAEVLETAWVQEAQIEAVLDAVLAVTFGGDVEAIAHARHTGEWCARIAAALPYGPDPAIARRVGALADAAPSVLERIPELQYLAGYVRDYQAYAIEGAKEPRTISVIVETASEFDARIMPDECGSSPSPAAVLRAMLANADVASRPIIEALADAVHSRNSARIVA